MQLARRLEPDGPTIGTVVPAHNRERTIERAVRSALEQTRRPERVVVVDDGSSDATAERVHGLGSDVQLIEQANAGAAAARNRGVAALDTDWVAFLDSDDHWTGGHLERMAAAISATGGDADLYFADARSTELEGGTTLWDVAGFAPGDDPLMTQDATEWVMLPVQPVAIQSAVIRRSRYLELGGMWPALRSREDTHLIFHLGLGHPACAVPGVGVVITADDRSGARLTSAAGSGTADYDRCTVLLYRDLLDRCGGLPPDERRGLRERLLDGYLSQASSALRVRDPSGLVALASAVRVAPGLTTRRVTRSVLHRGTPTS